MHTQHIQQLLLVLVVSIMLTAPFSAKATSIEKISFEQLAISAEVIFEGEVIGSESRWNAQNSRIHTYVDFRVIDSIKGGLNQPTLRLRFLGGQVGQDELRVEGMVYPQLAEKGIYFVASLDRPMANPLLGWSQGHYKLGPNDLMTSNKGQSVLEVAESQSKSSKSQLSSGTADGLRTSSQKGSGNGMSKQSFKSEINKILSPQQ